MVRTGLTDQAVGMAATVTVNDALDGHVGLDVECLDRILSERLCAEPAGGGQVVSFMTQHLGCPIPSPAIMEKIGTAFRKAVASFAEADHIPVVRFSKDDRKIDRMRPYLARQAATGRSGVAAIGTAQEFQNVFAASQRTGHHGIPWFSFTKADRRVACFFNSTSGTPISARRSSRCAPTSRTRSRCGSTATSGPCDTRSHVTRGLPEGRFG